MISKKFKFLISFMLILSFLTASYAWSNDESRELLKRGKELYKERKFEAAITVWSEVLKLTPSLAPYHIEAEKLIEKARREKMQKERDEIERRKKEEEKKHFLEVEKAWVLPKRRLEERERVKTGEDMPVSKRGLSESANRKVSLDFEDVHLRDVLNYLSKISGVNIVLDETVLPRGEGMGAGEVSPRVTIRLKEIPLIEALDVIARMKGLSYRLEENIIWITTLKNLGKEEMLTKTFSLQAGAGNIEEILRESMPWPEGSSFKVDNQRGNVIVHNTPTNLKKIEDTIRALDIPPIQVLITAKIVEIFSDSLEELAIGMNVQSSLPKEILQSGITIEDFDVDFERHSGRWLGDLSDYVSEGLYFIYQHLDPEAFYITVEALEKMGKAKLLSTPSVIALSNEESSIKLIEPTAYATGFSVEEETVTGYHPVSGDEVELHQDRIKVETEREDVGITLTVTPSVGADMKIITLTLKPELIEKLSEELIFSPNMFPSSYYIPWSAPSNYYGYVPLFFRRTVQSRLMVEDGESVLLGGLIKEERVKDETKVPFLGDVPLVGKFFRRDTATAEKRNLIIIITCNILTSTGEKLR